ncbi:MAG: glycosyltransferase family 39 protein [Chloroflexota bacterium]
MLTAPRAAARGSWAPALPHELAGIGALGRSEAVAVLAAAVVVFAVYVWASRYWVDLIDEGYFIYLGSRVQAGDLPYRDFDSYYTPGIFYLYAWTFQLFGLSVMPIRVLMVGVRVLWALLLYRLTRRAAPWPFALLPFLVIAAVDALPVFPEPHPSWPSILAVLAMTEVVACHLTSGKRRWIVLAGALAGLSFAFKQNIGAFAALALGGYLLLRERRQAGRLLRAAQATYAVGLAGAVTVLLWPGLSPQLAATLCLPLLVTLGLLVGSSWTRSRLDGWTTGLGAVLLDALAAGIPFLAVTLAWVVPLTLALGVRGVPWALFAGQVNQGALILPLDPPSPGTRPILLAGLWLPLVVAVLFGRRDLPWKWLLGSALVVSVGIALLPVGYVVDEGLVEDPGLYPLLNVLNDELGALFIYLPAIGAWAGLTMLAATVARRVQMQPLGWYLLAGTLTALGLYPRVDTIHAMFSGPLMLVVGAWGLAWVYRVLTGPLTGRASRIGKPLVYLSLLVIPLASVSPHVYWRYVTIDSPDPRAPEAVPYVDLGLPRAPVRVPPNIAVNVRGAVEYVQAGTPPGQPFFAYPVDPLFNFLADRPNPTRFNHFIAGALTPSDLQEVIRDLERAKPRYVLWDHGGATYFKPDLTNRVLSDYIWGCYQQVANFTPYLILERSCL